MRENDLRRIINLYKCGDPMDTNRLATLFRDLVDDDKQKELAEIDEYLSRELMLKRNRLMADTIEKKLKDDEYNDARMFFAVGAGKLVIPYVSSHCTGSWRSIGNISIPEILCSGKSHFFFC